MALAYDPQMNNPANAIVDELHDLRTRTTLAVYPTEEGAGAHTPFFLEGMVLKGSLAETPAGPGDYFEMTYLQDYTLSPAFISAGEKVGREIFSYVLVLRSDIKWVQWTYHGLGGPMDATLAAEITAAGAFNRLSPGAWSVFGGEAKNVSAEILDPDAVGRPAMEYLGLKLQRLAEAFTGSADLHPTLLARFNEMSSTIATAISQIESLLAGGGGGSDTRVTNILNQLGTAGTSLNLGGDFNYLPEDSNLAAILENIDTIINEIKLATRYQGFKYMGPWAAGITMRNSTDANNPMPTCFSYNGIYWRLRRDIATLVTLNSFSYHQQYWVPVDGDTLGIAHRATTSTAPEILATVIESLRTFRTSVETFLKKQAVCNFSMAKTAAMLDRKGLAPGMGMIHNRPRTSDATDVGYTRMRYRPNQFTMAQASRVVNTVAAMIFSPAVAGTPEGVMATASFVVATTGYTYYISTADSAADGSIQHQTQYSGVNNWGNGAGNINRFILPPLQLAAVPLKAADRRLSNDASMFVASTLYQNLGFSGQGLLYFTTYYRSLVNHATPLGNAPVKVWHTGFAVDRNSRILYVNGGRLYVGTPDLVPGMVNIGFSDYAITNITAGTHLEGCPPGSIQVDQAGEYLYIWTATTSALAEYNEQLAKIDIRDIAHPTVVWQRTVNTRKRFSLNSFDAFYPLTGVDTNEINRATNTLRALETGFQGGLTLTVTGHLILTGNYQAPDIATSSYGSISVFDCSDGNMDAFINLPGLLTTLGVAATNANRTGVSGPPVTDYTGSMVFIPLCEYPLRGVSAYNAAGSILTIPINQDGLDTGDVFNIQRRTHGQADSRYILIPSLGNVGSGFWDSDVEPYV